MLRLGADLIHSTPHWHIGGDNLLWADARGLQANHVAEDVLTVAARHVGDGARVGVARTAIAAEVAACDDGPKRNPILFVYPGLDREFLAGYSLSVLEPYVHTPRLMPMLADVGIETCGDFARLTLEAVEVRFGADAVALWRLSRADDPRLLFSSTSRALPSSSIDWEEYVLRDMERLIFVANNLTTSVCTGLRSWGETARAMILTFQLADGTSLERSVRTATATASRATWLRLIRAEMERTSLPDAVKGLELRVDAASALETPQGDLFDAGFQSARAVETAIAQLIDDKRAIIAGLACSSHPLVDRRATWSARTVSEALRASTQRTQVPVTSLSAAMSASETMLSLQLWPQPKPIHVQTTMLRGYAVPTAYRERSDTRNLREVELLVTAGPDSVSSDESGAPYSREYFHGLTPDGTLVLLYRDVVGGGWFLHGWWD